MHNSETKYHLITITLIIFLACAAYANSLSGEFLWDDLILIRDNIFIHDWSYLPDIFTKDWGAGARAPYGFYRPLPIFTYLLTHTVAGFDVGVYHLTNIALHISVALSLYWLITLLFDDRLTARLASALFIIHPVHSETVSYISNRSCGMMALFFILTLIYYIRFDRSGHRGFFVAAIVLFLASLLSKENPVILPGILLLYHFVSRRRVRLLAFTALSAVPSLYLIIRFTMKTSVHTHTPTLIMIVERIPGFFVAFLNYLGMLIYPRELFMDYGNPLFLWSHPFAWGGVLLALAFAVYTFRRRNRTPILFFSVAWFFITIIPVANIYPVAFYMSDHYLYLPSVGFFIITGYLFRSGIVVQATRRITLALFVACLCAGTYLTLQQNPYWHNQETFFLRTARCNPKSVRSWFNLGCYYADQGDFVAAEESFRKAITIYPAFFKAYNNLALIALDTNNTEEARRLLVTGLSYQPDYVPLLNTYAFWHERADCPEAALSLYRHAIRYDPTFPMTYRFLGDLYQKMGMSDKALAAYKQYITHDSD